ncbi:hypothetical protein [Emticicia sp. 17c]|uniref:hypothetical protein n=1 Tax=Emticicia sp. 17c TaxID=3127704 RepID=UPI00301DE1F9
MKIIDKVLIIVIIFICNEITIGQTIGTLKDIQGIWQHQDIRADEDVDKSYQSWNIIKNDTILTILYIKESRSISASLIKCGFQDKKKIDIDSLDVTKLKNKGKYFTNIFLDEIHNNNYAKKSGIIVFEYFELLDKNTLVMNGGHVSSFTKVDKLPSKILKMVKGLQQKDIVKFLILAKIK